MNHRFILASASPQRARLLEGLGLSFEIAPSTVDEAAFPVWEPQERCKALALAKARDVEQQFPDSWVLGCDTLVEAPDGSLLEKPTDADDAARMLRLQSGGTSIVHSGLALLSPQGQFTDGVSSSSVTFKTLTDHEVAWWVEGGLWQGRSGGFQIDGLGQFMIEKIEGDWTSIVGMPVFLFGELMRKLGLEPHHFFTK